MVYTATRLLAIGGALGTLALMVYAARPWGDNYGFEGFWEYSRLLVLAGWAILPYLLLIIMAKRAVRVASKGIFPLIGALIAAVGGMAAYMDALWLHPDPQAGLAFLAVPFYQLIIVGFLAGLQFLVKKSPGP